MHYTSSYLSFSLAGFPIPIVLVGSQRSSDRASSDAALNLIGAVKFLIESKTNGIYVAMHQDENDETIACHIGTRVRKNHTSKRDLASRGRGAVRHSRGCALLWWSRDDTWLQSHGRTHPTTAHG